MAHMVRRVPKAEEQRLTLKAHGMEILVRAGLRPLQLIRVMAPGDIGSRRCELGVMRETMLYIHQDGSPMSALIADDGMIEVRQGWE